MRDSSNDSLWSCSCNSSKEGLEDEMLLEKPLHRLTTHTKDDTSHWVRRGKKMLIPLNCAFLVINALVWLFVLGKQPVSTWGAFGGLKSRLGAPQVFSPSPAQEAVEHELHRFHGVGSDESEFNQPASDKLDSMWHELIDNGKWFAIDREMFVEINGNPDTGLRIPNDPQGRYLGMLQVNHQLHCVDVVRRATWYNIDRYRTRDMFGKMSDEDVIIHTNHCLEILRQTIKCHGDTAMLTYNWVHGHDWPQSAWRSLHSCQNWDRLNEWRSTHDISEMVTHLERPSWVLDRNAKAPGRTGAAEAVKPITCRDLDCSVPEDSS